ncbi:helix-turn-helix transcriptional regulator [Draconibacterium sp. IB214405]|uniref:helix-turn-helix transcriptional regulator n=1 Tax=Draconibacterium sp. IB214405 TaxID=3097352 RepID=UPI002A10DB16|nr:helix-turn-helix transcriptional regulator [Draconibacterium sp. IB214405]MDX8339568.1 helix-turn-helix transcriptional regulator [Draconibacterium sp. IB214405]
MGIEILAYSVTFIISAGISALGIMLAYQIYQQNKKPVFTTLLYQQIFLFSFLFYGVWGNISLRLVVADLNISDALSSKLAVFIPIIGIPFMIVSWFMLLKFANNVNGRRFTKTFIFTFFPTFVVMAFALVFLIHKGIITISGDADLFVVRILIILNLLVHLFVLLPFFRKTKDVGLLKETGLDKKLVLLIFAGTLLYSGVMFFFNVFGYISTCISLIILFACNLMLPAIIRFTNRMTEADKNMDFQAFCAFFEISKREAEIIEEICSGKSNKAIADKLFITLQTVKDHNHRIFTKTGVKSRVQLANLVREKTGSN